jgi:hypothetical protein
MGGDARRAMRIVTEEQTRLLARRSWHGAALEALDIDMSVPDLLARVFGTRSHVARPAGQVRSPAKTAAARANGAKGGRPRKSGLG